MVFHCIFLGKKAIIITWPSPEVTGFEIGDALDELSRRHSSP